MRIGYCYIFNLGLLNFSQEPAFPATRVHLTIILKIMPNIRLNIMKEPSTRCSFTGFAWFRSAITHFITEIFSDVTIPPGINGASNEVSLITLVTKALGLPRNLALLHIKWDTYSHSYMFAANLNPREILRAKYEINSIITNRGNNPSGHPLGTNKEKNFNPCSLNPKTVAPNTTVKLSENVNIKWDVDAKL